MLEVLLLVPLAYLLGTFPSAQIVARSRGVDITQEGSGNPGASNVARLLGWRAGILVLVLDFGKGTLAAAVGAIVDPSNFDGHRGAFLLGFAAVIGHVFPITRGFKGGRGVATAAGAMLVVFPLVVAVVGVVWVVIAYGFKKASIASVVCAFLFVGIVVARGASWLDMTVVSAMAAIILIRHGNSMLRVIRGEEHSLSMDSSDGVVDDASDRASDRASDDASDRAAGDESAPPQGTSVDGDG